MQILASVGAAKIVLGACGAKGKPLPDCHFWSFSGAGDVSGAHKNINRRARAVQILPLMMPPLVLRLRCPGVEWTSLLHSFTALYLPCIHCTLYLLYSLYVQII